VFNTLVVAFGSLPIRFEPTLPELCLGDPSNIRANQDGVIHAESADAVMGFDGPNSIIGRSVSFHEELDNLRRGAAGDFGIRLRSHAVIWAKQTSLHQLTIH
jgi:Cu/Zn superoxide dismutase